MFRAQRNGEALQVLLPILIFCNAGSLELTLTPWKCPGWLKIPLISFDLILKDDGLQQTYCHGIMYLPCRGPSLFFSLFSIGVVSLAEACICSSEIFLSVFFFFAFHKFFYLSESLLCACRHCHIVETERKDYELDSPVCLYHSRHTRWY